MSPGSDPVGRVLQSLHGPRYEIIGVAKDVNTATDNPIVYTFEGWDRRQTFLMAHFQGDAHAAEDAMRSAVRNLRPDLLVMPRTLQSYVDDAIENTWRVVILILMLGLVTMTLSVAGIYGVVSFTVTEKTRELGIRVALGAQKADIFREVLVSGARPVVLGLFVGLWIALAADSAIRTIFQSSPFELDAANPAVYLGSAAALAAAALAAMALIPLAQLFQEHEGYVSAHPTVSPESPAGGRCFDSRRPGSPGTGCRVGRPCGSRPADRCTGVSIAGTVTHSSIKFLFPKTSTSARQAIFRMQGRREWSPRLLCRN